MALTLTR